MTHSLLSSSKSWRVACGGRCLKGRVWAKNAWVAGRLLVWRICMGKPTEKNRSWGSKSFRKVTLKACLWASYFLSVFGISLPHLARPHKSHNLPSTWTYLTYTWNLRWFLLPNQNPSGRDVMGYAATTQLGFPLPGSRFEQRGAAANVVARDQGPLSDQGS